MRRSVWENMLEASRQNRYYHTYQGKCLRKDSRLRSASFLFGIVAVLGLVPLVDIDVIQELPVDEKYAQAVSAIAVLITTAIAEWRSRKGYGHKARVAGWISGRCQEFLNDLEDLWNQVNAIHPQISEDQVRKQNSSITNVMSRTTDISTQESFIHDSELVKLCQKEAFDELASRYEPN